MSPTPSNEVGEDRRNRARCSQTSNSRIRSDRATRTSNSVRDDPTNQSAKKKEVFIVGDSILKNLQGRKISRSAKVKVSSFPGCTTMDMGDHIIPLGELHDLQQKKETLNVTQPKTNPCFTVASLN